MKSFSTLLFTALTGLLLIPAGDMMAQDVGSDPLEPIQPKSTLLIGPVLGINRNFHTGGFRTVSADENCPIFTSGSGWGFLAGMTAEFQLGTTWSIIPRVMYESRPGSFTTNLPDAIVQIPAQDGNPAILVNQTLTASSEVSYSLISAEILYKQEFADLGAVRFAVAAGPALGMVIGGKNRQVQDLILPENAVFTDLPADVTTENGGRRVVFFDGDIVERNGMRLSLKAGLQAEVGLFNNAWIMTPGLYYDYGLSDVTANESWQLNTAMFMIDFRRAF